MRGVAFQISRLVRVWLVAACAQTASAYPVQSQDAVRQNIHPPVTEGVGFTQRLDAKIPHGTAFRDETGRRVMLGEFFGRRPVLLAMVYYGCPNLCSMVLNGTFKAIEDLAFDAGKDFDLLFVSIDPKEDAALAAAKKKAYLSRYRHVSGEGGLHFLTGEKAAIDQLAEAVGFRYRYDKASEQYAHPGGLMVLTPQGHVSRYLYGIEFPPLDLRLALTEASANRIGSLTDKFLLLCFHYDPAAGTYSLAILNALKLVGFLTAAALAFGIGFMLVKERERRLVGENPG